MNTNMAGSRWFSNSCVLVPKKIVAPASEGLKG